MSSARGTTSTCKMQFLFLVVYGHGSYPNLWWLQSYIPSQNISYTPNRPAMPSSCLVYLPVMVICRWSPRRLAAPVAHRGASCGCELWKRFLDSSGLAQKWWLNKILTTRKWPKMVILDEHEIVLGDFMRTLFSDFTTFISMMFPLKLPLIGLAIAM